MRLAILWLSVLAANATAAPVAETLPWLLAQHTAARGGRAAIEAVDSIQIELRIEEPTFTVDGRYVATRNGSMRIDVFADGQRVFTEALGHGEAWSNRQGNDAPAERQSSQGAAALRHGVEAPFKLFGLHEMPGRGHHLELQDRELVDGVNYYVILATLDDGYQTRYYLNPDTWLIDRERQYRALHVDVDPRPDWTETTFEDYREVSGVQYPFLQMERLLGNGAVLATSTTRRIIVNVPVDPAIFHEP